MKLSLLAERKHQRYYAVDLDGTLAKQGRWAGIQHIGKPIPAMVKKVKRLLSDGKTVKIFTARIANNPRAEKYIKAWCKKHLGRELEVTNVKDEDMIELWDNRARHVKTNTGELDD